MDDLVSADAVVTLTLDRATAIKVINGIRRFHDGWLKSLSEEEASRPLEDDARVTRHLPNHLARALGDLRDSLEDVKVTL
ncbi:hypothetical protein [Actinoplanes sp. NPDC049118]|uniref:hypothetical protein n=1 Tax=Actinoplanes sp. NPDC049118 TaxID=3155769 RepID=UPI0033CA3562